MSKAHVFADLIDGSALGERYHRLVELAPDAILIHDGEHITMANAAAVVLAGANHSRDLVGLPVDTILHPPYLKGIEHRLLDAGDDTRVPAVRDTFRRLDGSSVEVEVTAIPFLDEGRPSAHLVIRDITERLAVQEAAEQSHERIRHAEKMEAVGVLAGGVAHEVNNMMVVVLGFSELLLRDPRLHEDLAEDLRQIRNAGDRAAMVTSQLLSFSRRAFHQATPVDLDRVVHDLAPTLRHLLTRKSVLSCALDCAPQVLFDRSQLEQVLVNLTTNARDAMPKGGTITLTTGLVTIEREIAAFSDVIPPGRYGLASVSDTGTGMDPETLARIFEPFFTTKSVGKGTGLGLSAVYGVIRQNEGYIRVESAKGQGTTVVLYLPLAAERAGVEWRRTPRRAPADAPSGLTVLVVDDEPAVLSISARILEREGYSVLQASDGTVALEMIGQNGPPDLVVTDVMMPGIGGVELARRLKLDWPALPVIFMSGFSADDVRWSGAPNVAAALLQKPFLPDALVAAVAALLPQPGSTPESGEAPTTAS